MSATIQEIKQQLYASWSYLDVLALAMARTNSRRFSADPARWNRALADLQERLEPLAPNLLDDMYFDVRRPSMPFSEQVDAFFRVMQGSASLSLGNPSYQVYEMYDNVKDEIRNSQGPVLKQYDEFIALITEEMERSLALPD